MSDEALQNVTGRIAAGESPRRVLESCVPEMARGALLELEAQGRVVQARGNELRRLLSAISSPERVDALPPALADAARDILAAMTEPWDFVHMPASTSTHVAIAAYVHAAQEDLGVMFADALPDGMNRAALTHVSYEVSDGNPPREALPSVLGAVMCDCVVAMHPAWDGRDDLVLPKSSQLCAALRDSTLEETLSLEEVRIVRDVALLMNDPQAALEAVGMTDAWQATPHGHVIAAYARAASRPAQKDDRRDGSYGKQAEG